MRVELVEQMQDPAPQCVIPPPPPPYTHTHVIVEKKCGEAGRAELVQQQRQLGAVQRVFGGEEQARQEALVEEGRNGAARAAHLHRGGGGGEGHG